jgi:hypothetical protein
MRLFSRRILSRLCQCGLVVSLGWFASAASAQEVQWHAVAPSSPAVKGKTPVVTLDAPEPITAPARTPNVEPLWKPVSYSAPADAGNFVIRGQKDDDPKQMPGGTRPKTPDAPEYIGPPAGLPTSGPIFSSGAGLDACAPGCHGLDSNNCCPTIDANCCCTLPWNRNRFWVSGEYLLWFTKGYSLPPLVSTSVNLNDDVPGALGQPGTVVLFGNGHVSNDVSSGGRLRFGYWFSNEQNWGVEGSLFWLGQRSTNFVAASGGTPALFRPYFSNPTPLLDQNGNLMLGPGSQNTQFVAIPPGFDPRFAGGIAGAVGVSQTTRLWGAEANLRKVLCEACNAKDDCHFRMDGIWGFRFLALDEMLQINENLTDLPPSIFDQTNPVHILVQDQFTTKNRFYGSQLGLDNEFSWGRLFLNMKLKVALGWNEETVYINGQTQNIFASGSTLTSGGLLAQGSNIGRYSRSRFAVVPEAGFTVGYNLTDWWRLSVGYNFLYINKVVRPGQQIDTTVNPTQLPNGGVAFSGPARPAFPFKETDYWAQGVTFGMEFRY